MRYLILLGLLTSCSSSPITQKRCVEKGGNTTVYFHKLNKWVCCKIVKVNTKVYCQEIE